MDQDKWIFIEPQALLANPGFPSGLEYIKDARQEGNRLVYCPHFYPFFEEGDLPSDLELGLWEGLQVAKGKTLESPVLIGEFMAKKLIPDILQAADQMGIGWAYWDSDDWLVAKSEEQIKNSKEIIEKLVRTYPQRIAGDPIEFSFDPTSASFKLEFRQKEGVTGETEIFIPVRPVTPDSESLYPIGWDLQVSGSGDSWSSTWDEMRQILSVKTDPAQTLQTIRITRKGQS